MSNQKGLAPIILILLAAIGLILWLLISNTFSFKDKLFNTLFPKPPSHAQEQGASVPDEILLKFKPGVKEHAKEQVLNANALQKIDSIPQIEVDLVKVPEQARDKVIEAFKNNPLIEYAEPNYIVTAQLTPNDPYFPNQWALAKISAPTGWDITTGSSQAVIAIIDTGIDTTHEDLKDKLAPGGWDLVNKDNDPTDDNGHGTLVSGVAAAATNNSKGMAGVCWLCPILAVKVLDNNASGSDSAVTNGIIYATDSGAKVINMSLGTSAFSQTMQNAVNYAFSKGMVLVAASGNTPSPPFPMYPAAFDNVIAVGATNQKDERGIDSNYGSWLDVVGPGYTILTTLRGSMYGGQSGTSLSSSQVAGLVGLILSVNSSLANQQVVNVIISTADDLGPAGKDDEYGYGRINVAKALKEASGRTVTLDAQAPTILITSPTSGATVFGIIDISASASDNVAVTKVEFYVDGKVHATDTTSPYLASWDTTLYSNGSHNLQTKAYDLAGNVGESTLITVNVDNTIPTPTPNPVLPDTTAPTVSIIYPSDGSTVTRNSQVTIQASATDNVKVSKVEFYIGSGSKPKCIDTSPDPNTTIYTCLWKVGAKTGTNYTIKAQAYDPSGNPASYSVTVKTQ